MTSITKTSNKAAIAACCLLSTIANTVLASEDTVNLKINVGYSWQDRNDVQIPNTNEGTRFSLADAAGAGPVKAARVEFKWAINEKHGVRVLLAPLSYTKSVIFDQPVQFVDNTFAANQATEATYMFNSYRFSYFYSLVRTPKTQFDIGATIKIRDAEIRLEQAELVSTNDNIGFVPLLYLSGSHKLSDKWTLSADLDGLAGGPGRAIDLGIALEYSLSKRWMMGAEVRVLDGGADNERVYNFAQFNSATLSVSTGF